MLPHTSLRLRLCLARTAGACCPLAAWLPQPWRRPPAAARRTAVTTAMSAAIEESGAAASGQGPPLPSAVEPGVAPGDGEGADERSDSPAAEPGKRRKRKLALHLAYTGTAFSGSQLQRHDDSIATVEGVLETALFRAGCILESNMGALEKLGWSRSSRTDKGVHSLATVVSVKLEVEPERFDADPEGLHLAQDVNRHLPPEVRVLSAQRVNRSFSARTDCRSRTYVYFLPAAALGLRLDGGAEDAAALARLRAALAAYVGTHPFHNFTRRRLYRPAGPGQKTRWHKRAHYARPRAAAGAAGAAGAGAPGASPEAAVEEDDEAEDDEEESPTNAPGAAAAEQPAGGAGGEAGPRRERRSPHEPLDMGLRWSDTRDPADGLSRGLFRTLMRVEAGAPAPLLPGRAPCIQVTVAGASFMLHQIRHMVGGAVLVARGQAPLAWLHAALAGPARTHVPLAPPQVLVLADAAFFPFRQSQTVTALSGAALGVRAGGLAAQGAFREEVLFPALQPLLCDETWSRWEATLGRIACEPDAMAAFLASHEAWRAQRDARRAPRANERDAAAAPALAAAGPSDAGCAAAAADATCAAPSDLAGRP